MSEKKFLDRDGLLYVWTKLKAMLNNKVDAKEGMTLSHNDLTDELKQKILDAGSSSFNGTYDALTGKPKINDKELKAENSLEELGIQASEAGKGLSEENYTNTDKTKLGGIAEGAEVNKIDIIKKNGVAVAIEEKAVDLEIPTKISELDNDEKFAKLTEVTQKVTEATQDMATQTYVLQQVANINKKQVVSSTEEMTDENIIYLMSNTGEENNVYDEYIVYEGAPEKIGTTEVDLTNYIQDSDLVAITNLEIDGIFTEE